jgi:negative regulator of flagellin synthesis FlgM
MKIQGNKSPEGQEISINPQKVVSKPEVKDKMSAPVGKTKPFNDRVEISGTGKEVAEIIAAVNQLPDVRNDKVKAIKEAIDSGKYQMDSIKIAEKILGEL